MDNYPFSHGISFKLTSVAINNRDAKELDENKLCIMRRINSSGQGGGARHSGAMSNDDNEAMADLDKQNA